MKHIKRLSIIALTVAIVLFAAGCDENGEEDVTYTVTFNSNGGSSVEAVTGIVSGSTITLPAAPERYK